MAETFKNAHYNDAPTGVAATVYTAPASTTSIILGVAIANKSGNSVAVSLFFNDFSSLSTTTLLGSVQIPPNTTLEVLAGQKYILETSDYIGVLADTASSIDITMGVLEIS